MREGWKVKLLNDLLDIQNGFAFNSKQFSSDGEMPLIRIRDIKRGNGTETRYSGEYDDKYLVRAGDFLIGMDGEFECHEWKGADALLNQRVCRLENFSARLIPRFLYYGINKYLKNVEDVTTFTTVKHISSRQIKAIEFPVPPISEQKRIVAILDEAFAGIDTAIANTEKNLANARELFESYLNAEFSQRGEGWTERLLSDISKIDSSLVDPRKAELSNLPHVGAANMVSKTGAIVNVQTAYEEGLKSGKFLFDESMVLYSKIRPYLEKVARPSFTGLCSADVYPISPKSEYLLRDFLYYMLLSKEFTDYAIAGSARAGMPKINRGHLFQYRAALPSIKEQQRLIDSLDNVALESQRLEMIYKQKLTALARLKQSLLQKAFSGELTADNVVPITAVKKTNASLSTDSPAFAAHIMAAAFHWHESQGRNKTFGHVKAQKTLHLVEALAQVDLGREPIKDAAGPNDFPHMRMAEQWAKDNDFFEFVQRQNGQRGYDFIKGKRYGEWLPQALDVLKPYRNNLDRVVSLLMPLDTQEAELVATTYAAWNNLLLDGVEPTESAIIHEARENWSSSKQQYSRERFLEAINQLRSNGIVPTGSGKRVNGQESLPL